MLDPAVLAVANAVALKLINLKPKPRLSISSKRAIAAKRVNSPKC